MFNALLRARLAAYWAWFSGASRSKKKRSNGKAVLFALLMVYVLGCFGVMMFGIFSQLAEPFSLAGLGWLYFTMYGIMTLSLMVIGSVFLAKSQLYEAKDNDLLLSMPIRPRDILATRMLSLVITNLVYGLIAAVPAALAWGLRAAADIPGTTWLCFVLVTLGILLLSLSLSCLLALALSAATRRMSSKTVVDTILSLVFLLVYFWFCFRMNSMISTLASSGDYLAGKLGAVRPLFWLGAAIASGDVRRSFIIFIACLIPFLLIYAVLSATFIGMATAKRGGVKKKYVDRGQKVSTPAAALLRRESMRFTSSSVYMINAGLSDVFLVVCAVLMIVRQHQLYAFLYSVPGIRSVLTPMMLLALCLIIGMTLVSAPSVSIEGKNLWIAQSLPLPASEILMAKLRLHMRIIVPPTILAQAAFIFVFRPTGAVLACTVLLPLIFDAFTAVLGLMANLRHPDFNWITETQAVKSGASVMIAMFGSWGAVILPGAAVLIFSGSVPAWIILSVYTAAAALLTWLMYRWIMTRGATIYSEL